MRITESKLRRIIRQVISESRYYNMPNELGSINFVLNLISDVCNKRGLICIENADNDIYAYDIIVRVGRSLSSLKTINFQSLLDSIRDCGSDLELCRKLVEEEIERCCL